MPVTTAPVRLDGVLGRRGPQAWRRAVAAAPRRTPLDHGVHACESAELVGNKDANATPHRHSQARSQAGPRLITSRSFVTPMIPRMMSGPLPWMAKSAGRQIDRSQDPKKTGVGMHGYLTAIACRVGTPASDAYWTCISENPAVARCSASCSKSMAIGWSSTPSSWPASPVP